jgi:hypothetical protein
MKYNTTKQPPAPIANVILRNLETLESIKNVPMLLVTGSEITLLPRAFCQQIGVDISKTNFLELRGFNNTTSLAYYAKPDLIFLNKRIRGNFLVFDIDEEIIGRNILNKFTIVFDGKNLEWKVIS